MEKAPPSPRRLATTILLVALGYYAGAVVGVALRFPPTGVSSVWPATPVLLAGLLLTPPATWWLLVLAVMPVHFHVMTVFYPDKLPIAVLVVQLGTNVLQAVLAAAVMRRISGETQRFDTLRGMGSFILVAALGASAVGCIVAAVVYLQIGWATDFWDTWRHRVLCNVFAILAITPVILLTAGGELLGQARLRRHRHLELAILSAVLVASSIPVFTMHAEARTIVSVLLLVPLPCLLWAAVRFGPGGLCIALSQVATVTLISAYVRAGPFADQSAEENVLSLQVFLIATSIPLLLLAALVQEQLRAEEKERQQRDALAHAQRVIALGELAISLAHEINQPLLSIAMNAGAAERLLHRRRRDVSPLGEIMKDITKDVERATRIVSRLRAHFRKESATLVRVRMDTVIGNVLQLMQSDLRQRRIAVHFAPRPVPAWVYADPVQLEQVFVNVIMNACDAIAAASNGSRAITIEVMEAPDARVAVAVRDSGIGIGQKDAERIFEPFVTSKRQGLGMGLAISRSIIRAHGGRMWATPNGDSGATIRIELPKEPTLVDRQTREESRTPRGVTLPPSVRIGSLDGIAAREAASRAH
ncbi:MAG TPA: MASE1 domain-containing protein [Gemmatimonadaceae bacterium]|nr:MASE1 domain-containing protein [Gemmatimonadaceae bacterium]